MDSSIDLATSLIVLPPDAKLLPVPELSARVRSAIGPVPPGHAVLTRPGYRVSSRLIPGPLAQLLEEFRAPSLLTDGILRFARANEHDPFQALEFAFDALVSLVEARFLVPDGSPDLAGPPPSFGAGQAFAGFEIDRMIRSLEDSEVYRARGPDGSFVALKIARDDRPDMTARIAHEAQVLGSLTGTDTPALLGSGIEGNRPFIAMEWCDGVTISTAAQRLRATRDRRRLHDLVSRMFAAYARLHQQGVLHGDIHPGNCLVTDTGRIVILDFGNARKVDGAAEDDPWRTGIPHFHDPQMAAAVLAGKVPPAASPQSEQYALAALAYLLLTGKQRIAVTAVQEGLLQRIAVRPMLPFAAQGVPSWPEVEAVLGRALAHEPSDRFPDAGALARAFSCAGVPSLRHDPWPESTQATLDAALEEVRTLGSAGDPLRLAWFALRAAVVLEDAGLLAAASVLACRTGTGWMAHLISAFVAQTGSDSRSEERSIAGFLDAVTKVEDGPDAAHAILAGASILTGSPTRSSTAAKLDEWTSQWLDQHTNTSFRDRALVLPDAVQMHLTLSLCSTGMVPIPINMHERLTSMHVDVGDSPWLWALANDVFADARFTARARSARLPGSPLERGFALLRLFQVDGDAIWVARTRDLVVNASTPEFPALDRALLMIELLAPEQAVRPPFVSPFGMAMPVPQGDAGTGSRRSGA